MARPALIAYHVTEGKEVPEGVDKKKGFWREVGALWARKNGGFDLIIPDGISITGRIICLPPKDKE